MVKEQIELVEGERLLTEQERSHIINAYENRDWKLIITLCVISCFLITALILVLAPFDNISCGIIFSLIVNAWVFHMYWYTLKLTNDLVKSIKSDELYVREAVYLDSNKYRHASFYVKERGRKELFFSNALNQDNVKRGDKVILIQMGKRQVWIYKAREDEMQAD